MTTLRIVTVLCLASLGSACTLGPRNIAPDRFDYTEAIARSNHEQLLANLVRLRYNEPPVFLGMAFDAASGEQPKRDVLLDTLRRAYPDAAGLAVRAPAATGEPAIHGTLTIAVRGGDSHSCNDVLGAAAGLLNSLAAGRVRSRAATSWHHRSRDAAAWLTHGDEELQDPGDTPRANAVLDIASSTVQLGEDGRTFEIQLAGDRGVRLESLLGGLFGALKAAKLIDPASRRIVNAHRARNRPKVARWADRQADNGALIADSHYCHRHRFFAAIRLEDPQLACLSYQRSPVGLDKLGIHQGFVTGHIRIDDAFDLLRKARHGIALVQP